MLIAVASIFALALAASWLQRVLRGAAGLVLAGVPLGVTLYFASQLPRVAAGTAALESYAWVPSLGVSLAFALDGLSLLFAFLICGIGFLIVIYAGGYLAGHPRLGRFYTLLFFFMGSMLGLVLADNLVALFIFWELTSISSYLLIGFDHQKAESRASALQALLITGGGGLLLLAGMILLSMAGGTQEISVLLERGDQIRAHPLYAPIFLLMLAGAVTKSAQFPFHFWLPGAMAAPTPVSAYLHSATMVKAGVYLLARFHPALGGTELWTTVLPLFGGVTMLVGGVLAVCQTDLKRILAYSTVSALGTLVFLLGLGTTEALKAAVVFLLAHALYKGALFMVAGALDHETGTRDVEKMGGLRRAMPITAAIAVLAAVSLAGFGPVFSFIGKEMLFEAVLHSPERGVLPVVMATLSGALFAAVAAIVALRPFFGAVRETPKSPHEAPPSLWLGPGVLAVLGLLLGIVPGGVAAGLISPAAAAVIGVDAPVKLALWHGFNAALALSAASVILGLIIYLGSASLRRALPRWESSFDYGPARWYRWGLAALSGTARVQTQFLQHGYLRFYLMAILMATIGLVGYTLLSRSQLQGSFDFHTARFHEVVIAGLILAAALAAVFTDSRLTAIASLGVVGNGVALIYMIFGAPDLAMTQILIETLTVILFVLAFYHLPRFINMTPAPARMRDAVISIAFGALMTALVLVTTGVQFHPPISRYFAENSVPLAFGRNVVNVILVDFRGIDTLGEITVLAVAGIGVYALLKLRPEDKESKQKLHGAPPENLQADGEANR